MSHPIDAIAIEEHYLDRDFAALSKFPKPLADRLLDIDGTRLSEMDAGGIAMQVLSHAPSAAQLLDVDQSIEWSRRINDNLAATIALHPDRFAGFAALPTPAPEAAADELERTASELGFRGAMLHGLTNNRFHDEKHFWPIFARAEKLDLPIYIHPGLVHPGVQEAYYAPYAHEYTTLPQAALGFTCEMMTAAVRLVLSGVFEAHPNLKLVLGHMGEGLPFLLERVDESLARNTKGVRRFRDTFCRGFHITTSANFSTPALLCAMMEMGVDRILYAIDWPFIGNEEGRRWIDGAPISADDRAKILHRNARKLLKL